MVLREVLEFALIALLRTRANQQTVKFVGFHSHNGIT